MNVISVEIRYTSHSYKIHENHVGAPYGRRASGALLGRASSSQHVRVASSGLRPRCHVRPPAAPEGSLLRGARRDRRVRGAARSGRTRVPTRYFQGRRFAPHFLYCFATFFHAPHKPVARSSPRPRLRWDFAFPSGGAARAPHPRAAGKQGAIEKQGAGKGGA